MFNLLKRCWKGEESLAKAYWLVHILFGIIIAIPVIGILSIFYPLHEMLSGHQSFPYTIAESVMLPYNIFTSICVWRCGKNSNLFWRVVSRIFVMLAIYNGVIQFIRFILFLMVMFG